MGKARRYTKEILAEAVSAATSVAGVIRYLGLAQAGGTHTYLSRKIREMNLDTSHFRKQGWSRGKSFPERQRTANSILVKLPPGSFRQKSRYLRRALLEHDIQEVCVCGIGTIWNGISLVLEIDHIDGDFLNNELSNLRFLCPNCHSQQKLTNRSWKTLVQN